MKRKLVYIFAGNRFFVLEEMLKLKLSIKKIFAVPGSYLEKELIRNKYDYELLTSKKNFVEYLLKEEFDYLIVNGCPFILPISTLSASGINKNFINIHPSYLPDLRGADPQPAALLFGRDSGATCHIMNDEIDSGNIISQVKIKYSKDYDVNLLYQITFFAEKEVFINAYKKKFVPTKKQNKNNEHIYYSFRPEDLIIDFNESGLLIYQKVKAFNNPNKGARFTHNSSEYKVYDSIIIKDRFIKNILENRSENEIVLKYSNTIGLKKNDQLLVLKNIEGDFSKLNPGDVLAS